MVDTRKALGLVSALFTLLLLNIGCGGSGKPAAPVAPTIVAPPQNQTVLEGATAQFAVTAGGTAPLTYQWSKAGTAISGATTSAYTTPATALADSGTTYTVTVTNSVGTITSSPATLTVRPNPVITLFTAAPTAITAGGSATLHFEFTGGTGTVDHGVNAVTSGTDVTVTPAATTTYTLSVDNGFGTTKTSAATVTVVPAPVKPIITAAPIVTAGMGGLAASVPVQTNMSYLWTISGGTITAGATSPNVQYSAGGVGTLTLNCTVSNSLNVTAVADPATVSVVAAPVATSLVASTSSPLYGATVTLTPTFSGGTATIGSTGVSSQDITASAATGNLYTTPALTSAKTYTLTVSNLAGDFATRTVTITPQTVAVAAITPANKIVTVNEVVAYTSSVTGALDSGLTWTATGGTVNAATGAWTAPATAGTFTITATANADGATRQTTGVTVAAAAITPTITPSATIVTSGHTATASVPPQQDMLYKWTITNGTIVGTDNGTTVTFSTGSPATTTLTCTVTNLAGASAPAATASVTVVAPPTASLAASTTTPEYGATATLTPTFTGVSASIDQGIGAVTTGTGYPTAAITAATTYRLTARNAADDTATTSVTLTPQTVVVGAISPASTDVSAGDVVTFTSTGVTGAVDKTITWTATGATPVSNGNSCTWTAPGTPGNYTITATSVAGTTATASVRVVAIPTKPVISVSNAYVSTGKTGLTASVATQLNMTYTWTITGGTPTGGQGTNQITYTAGPVGTITLNCTVANALGASSAADPKSVNVVALPTAALVADTLTPEFGAQVTLTPTFTNGSGVIDQGLGTVSNGNGKLSAAITSATSFTLTVTNPQTNDTATARVDVTPQTVVVGAISPAASIATVERTVNFTSAGVTGALDKTLAWLATGGTINPTTGAWTAPTTAGTYTITATSNADATKKATTTVKVVPAPDATISAPTTVAPNTTGLTASVPTQTAAFYDWSLTGNGSITSTTNGPSITFSSTTAGPITLTCTVTNEAGLPASGTATVTVNAINHPPTFTTTPPSTIHTQQLYSYTVGTNDPDGDAVTLSLVSAVPSYGGTDYTLTTQPTLAGNTLTWTPWEIESNYTITFTLRATDDKGAWTDQVWSVVMNATTYGSLTQGSAMSSPRDQHTVTQILNGKILIVGGSGQNTAILYDPTTKLYASAGTMINGNRSEHKAVASGNKVWIFGGYSGVPASVERWNNTLNGGLGGFEDRTPLKNPRLGFSIHGLGSGKFLIVGGAHPQTGASVAEIELYDTTANGAMGSTTVVGSLITPRWGHCAFKSTDGSKLFVFGGGADNGNNGVPNTYATTTEVINLGTFAVTSQAGLATRRVYTGAVNLPDGRTIILGGVTGTNASNVQTLATSESINRDTGAVLGAGPNLVHPTMDFALAQLFDGTTLLVAGGGSVTLVNGTVTNAVGYDTMQTWDASANGGAGAFVLVPGKFSTPKSRISRVTCVSNVTGEFMVFGGNGTDPVNDLSLSAVDLYSPINPLTNTFVNAGNLVNATKGGRLVTIGDGQTLFVDQGQAQTQIFDLGTNAWTAGPTLQSIHEDGAVLELPGNNVAIFSGASSWASAPVVTPKVEWVWRNPDGTFGTECAGTSVLNYGRVALTATFLPDVNKALVVGGMAGANISVPQIELYDPSANGNNGGSTVIGNLSTPVAYHQSIYANGKVYIVGGVKDPGNPTMALPAKVQIVNPTTGAVTLGANMPNTTQWFGGQGIQLRDGRLLLAGSAVLGGALNAACYLFDPNANSGLGAFTITGSMNTARMNASLSLLADGRVLMTGGRTVFDGTQPGMTGAEIYDPASGTWSAVAQAMSATRAAHASGSLKDGSVLIVGNAIDGQGPTAQGSYAERFK